MSAVRIILIEMLLYLLLLHITERKEISKYRYIHRNTHIWHRAAYELPCPMRWSNSKRLDWSNIATWQFSRYRHRYEFRYRYINIYAFRYKQFSHDRPCISQSMKSIFLITNLGSYNPLRDVMFSLDGKSRKTKRAQGFCVEIEFSSPFVSSLSCFVLSTDSVYVHKLESKYLVHFCQIYSINCYLSCRTISCLNANFEPLGWIAD